MVVAAVVVIVLQTNTFLVSYLFPYGVTSHQLRLSYEMMVVVLRISAFVNDTYQCSLRAASERECIVVGVQDRSRRYLGKTTNTR